ncbi:MAG: succinate CoA transferase [Fibrobacteraceae bacterium]|nr:succinate CoA transferase [Fibrobacteraceae bacterium]
MIFMTAEEAAELVENEEVIGVSGFTLAGYPKAVPTALAKRAERLHAKGEEFQVTLFSGASTGDECDGALARAKAIKWRMPYQSNKDLRKSINEGSTSYTDAHLGIMGYLVRTHAIPAPTLAIIEVSEVSDDGKIWLSSSGGNSKTYLTLAKKIILEVNSVYGDSLIGIHDSFLPELPPFAKPIPIQGVLDRAGDDFIQVDPKKIIAVVRTDKGDSIRPFTEPDDVSKTIAGHILEFLEFERKKGRIPDSLPYQSGVGNVANAVLTAMARDPKQKPASLFTEVIQEAVFELIRADKLIGASGTALTCSSEARQFFKANTAEFKKKFILRQQEVSNHPEVIRRLGVISMNTALECDIYGNVNSSHVSGTAIMNGIGGSADFARNCYLGFFMTPSTAKDGTISSITPLVSHVDHTDHETMVFVTEQGLADLRGLDPVSRAKSIIDHCAHPKFRQQLNDFLNYSLSSSKGKHIPIALDRAFNMHLRFLSTGTMNL